MAVIIDACLCGYMLARYVALSFCGPVEYISGMLLLQKTNQSSKISGENAEALYACNVMPRK